MQIAKAGRDIELCNSFELDYNVIDGVVVIDRDYYNTKEEQFKQVRLMLTDNTSMYNNNVKNAKMRQCKISSA